LKQWKPRRVGDLRTLSNHFFKDYWKAINKEKSMQTETELQETQSAAPIIMDDEDAMSADFERQHRAMLSRISELETEVKNLSQHLNGG
jgi:hypothetical protein